MNAVTNVCECSRACPPRASTGVPQSPRPTTSSTTAILHLQDFEAAFHYTTGAEFEVAGRRVDAETTAAELADSIVPLLPDPGIGIDAEYVAWYGKFLDLARRHRALPIAYADYFDDDRGWEIGWGAAFGSRRLQQATRRATEPESRLVT